MQTINPLAISRRQFIARTGAALASTAVAPAVLHSAGTPKAVVGSNVYGWTQYYSREKKPFKVEEVIAALSDCGYDYLESFLDLGNPQKNVEFSGKLKAKGLRLVSMYAGPPMHEVESAKKSVSQALKCCEALKNEGLQVLSFNPAPIGREKTDEELKTQVAALIELGRGLNAMGIKLGIHHHLPEMKNGAREFHYNFRNSPPEVVGFCYDVHWVWKGGIQPQDALREYGNRVVTMHIRQSRENIWWEDLDTGDVDYDYVARYVREHNLPQRFTVELALEGGTKVTRSAIENHRRSREFIRRVFGV